MTRTEKNKQLHTSITRQNKIILETIERGIAFNDIAISNNKDNKAICNLAKTNKDTFEAILKALGSK